MGYVDRVVTLRFPELSDDPADSIWVTMRNPKLVPLDELRSGTAGLAFGEDGMPADMDAATASAMAVLAKLVVGWHVYDATAIPQLNAAGEAVGEQLLLPQAPVTPQMIGKLPMAIQNAMSEVLASVNPQTTSSPEATSTPS